MAYGDFEDLTKKQLQIKFWEIKLLKLKTIQNMMDIKEVLLLWFIIFFIKNLQVVEK